MSGVVYRFRSEVRTRWRAWLALGMLVGAVGATVVVLAAGARRTGSAHDRFLTTSRAYDVGVATFCTPDKKPGPEAPETGTGCQSEVARLPAVADAAILSDIPAFVATVDGRSLQPDARDACYSGPGQVGVALDPTGRFGTEINRARIVAGRRADRAAADEVVISRATAQRFHLRPGSALLISLFASCEVDRKDWRQPTRVRIVGVQISPGEIPTPSGLYLQSVVVTPAFVRAAGTVPARHDYLAVRLRPGATAEILQAQARHAGYTVEVAISQVETARSVERAIRPTAVSLAVLGALMAFAGIAVLGQVLARQAWAESADAQTLAALGMGRGRRILLGLLRAASVGVVAGGVAAALGFAASPFMPVGLAREVEPHRGFAFDATVLGLGALATFLFVVAASAISVWRLARTTTRTGGRDTAVRARIANVAARAGLSPAAVSGARLAFERGNAARAVPVVSSFAGLTIAVAAVVGALTFGASLSHLRSSPRLVGWNWDIVLGYPDAQNFAKQVSPAEAVARADRALRAHPGVTDFAKGSFWPVFSNGQPVLVGARRVPVDSPMAFDGTSRVGPSVISGRKPSAPDEILLGPQSLAQVGAHIGDEVEVTGQGTWDEPTRITSARVRVVGTGVLPTAGQLGRGSAMTQDGLARLAPGLVESAIYVRLAPGTDPNTIVDAFARAFPEVPRESINFLGDKKAPDPSLNLEQIDSVPWLFAGVMGLMAAAVLGHVLVTAIRTRRRDLAVLRALGFSRSQTVRTVAYEAAIYAVVALLIGSPIGVALGRVAWRVYADGLGVVPESVTPWIALGLTIACSIALALGIAIRPAWNAARIRPAITLRTE